MLGRGVNSGSGFQGGVLVGSFLFRIRFALGVGHLYQFTVYVFRPFAEIERNGAVNQLAAGQLAHHYAGGSFILLCGPEGNFFMGTFLQISDYQIEYITLTQAVKGDLRKRPCRPCRGLYNSAADAMGDSDAFRSEAYAG